MRDFVTPHALARPLPRERPSLPAAPANRVRFPGLRCVSIHWQQAHCSGPQRLKVVKKLPRKANPSRVAAATYCMGKKTIVFTLEEKRPTKGLLREGRRPRFGRFNGIRFRSLASADRLLDAVETDYSIIHV